MARRKGLTFYQKKKKLNIALIHEIISWIFWIVMSIILALLVVYCIGMKTSIIGSSMEPSLYNGQEIFLNRLVYKITSPKAGDVVVFLPNGNEKSHYYVKRVVAVPGDELYVKNGILYVNNEVQDEYINDKIAEAGLAENKIELGDDEYFENDIVSLFVEFVKTVYGQNTLDEKLNILYLLAIAIKIKGI